MMYRETDSLGHIRGGPMLYLRTALAELGAPRLGRALSVPFCVMCIGGSLGGGNMFQANPSYAQVAHVLPIFRREHGALAYGLSLAVLVGRVIIGGIRRISAVASLIVPGMVVLYMLSGLIILATHAAAVGPALVRIVEGARPEREGTGGPRRLRVAAQPRSHAVRPPDRAELTLRPSARAASRGRPRSSGSRR